MPASDPTSLSTLLRRFRNAAGLSQENLAEASGVSTRTVSDLERGTRPSAHPTTMTMLADGLGLTGADRMHFLSSSLPEARSERARAQQRTSELHLPEPLTSLIGRETELEEIAELLVRPDVRVLALTGPGGVGKTRLAIEAARQAAGSFANGAVFVNLAAVTEPTFVASAIAQTLGIADSALPPEERLATVLADRQQLLVLDNFEHVVDAAPLIARLVAAAPRVTVLVTSRVRLRLTAEIDFAVPPLVLPGERESLETISQAESVRLFIERARAVDSAFAVSDHNGANVVEICRRLEGVPLAIELAAPKLNVLPIAALASLLDHPLPVLVGGNRDWPERQRSMRQTIAWSYNLLAPAEQRLLRWLSVFVGGCSWEAVEATGAAIDLDTAETFETLATLVDNALIRGAHGVEERARFQILEPIKDFLIEELDANGELAAARETHARHFLWIVERGGPVIGPNRLARTFESDRELGNLYSALAWCIENEQTEIGLRIANAMAFVHWTARGRFQEQRIWISRVIALPGAGLEYLRADAWVRLAWVEMLLRNVQAAEAAAWLGMADARLSGNEPARAWALIIRGYLDAYEDLELACEHLNEALIIARLLGDQPLLHSVHTALGITFAWYGEYENSLIHFEAGVAILRELDDPWKLADLQIDLANTLRKLGRTRESARVFREGLQRQLEFKDEGYMWVSMVDAASVAVAIGRFEHAAILLGASAQLRDRIGVSFSKVDQVSYDSTFEATKSGLGDLQFTSAWSQGESLSIEELFTIADQVMAEWGEEAAPNRSATAQEFETVDGADRHF